MLDASRDHALTRNEFIVARNPQQGKLPYLLRLPLMGGILWLKAAAAWPRVARVYCHRLEGAFPALEELEVAERVAVIVCQRRGPAIDLVLDRAINKRSQFVFATSKGRELIFWQTALSAKTARPGLRVPVRNPGEGTLYVDTRERYGFSFCGSPLERRRLAVGDYAAIAGDQTLAVVERKSLADFIRSIVSGNLGFEMTELATIANAAIVVEGTYSAVLRHSYARPGFLASVIAKLAIRYPAVSINFLESKKLAEQWTLRYLLTAYTLERHGALLPSVGLHVPSQQINGDFI